MDACAPGQGTGFPPSPISAQPHISARPYVSKPIYRHVLVSASPYIRTILYPQPHVSTRSLYPHVPVSISSWYDPVSATPYIRESVYLQAHISGRSFIRIPYRTCLSFLVYRLSCIRTHYVDSHLSALITLIPIYPHTHIGSHLSALVRVAPNYPHSHVVSHLFSSYYVFN